MKREIKFRARHITIAEQDIFITGYSHLQQGYVMVQVKNHPYSNKRGYVPMQRLVMEEHLGRFLIPREELVHHIDGNRANNNLPNLKLTSPIIHPKEHQVGRRNDNGQFVARDPKFQQEKYRLFNRDTGLTQIYTLSELISKTFRRAKFKYRGKWTGLKDKNGKEIYEGDIVEIDRWDNFKKAWRVFYLGKIEYSIEDGGYCSNSPCSNGSGRIGNFTSFEATHCKVIGNIYENPELLNK